MQVGDLVELSSYGRKLKCNKNFVGLVGLIVMVDSTEQDKRMGMLHPATAIMVSWVGTDFEDYAYHIRRDLKYVNL